MINFRDAALVMRASDICFNCLKRRFAGPGPLCSLYCPAFTPPFVIPNLSNFLSSAEHKIMMFYRICCCSKRFWKSCTMKVNIGPHWHSLYGQIFHRRKSNRSLLQWGWVN